MAGSTQWGTRHIAAIEKFVVSANVGFLAQGPTHPIGHNRSFACSRKLPPERPFNSGTRQTANSYNSANADAQECQEQWQLYTKLQTSTHQRDSIETAVAVNTHQKSMFSATPADAFLTSERLGCRFAFPQPQSTQDCSGRAGCGKNALG